LVVTGQGLTKAFAALAHIAGRALVPVVAGRVIGHRQVHALAGLYVALPEYARSVLGARDHDTHARPGLALVVLGAGVVVVARAICRELDALAGRRLAFTDRARVVVFAGTRFAGLADATLALISNGAEVPVFAPGPIQHLRGALAVLIAVIKGAWVLVVAILITVACQTPWQYLVLAP